MLAKRRMQKASLPHLAPIDGLRAVAVLSVILYHLNAHLVPGGFIGVDIFFVISGFVVSGALPPSGIAGIRQLLTLFYARRATRILPALYVCLLISTVLSALFIPPSWLSRTQEQTGLAALWGYSNFVLARGDGDYFAPSAEFNAFTHTWSLGVEEQFYAVFPWLFLAWLTGRRALSMSLFATGAVVSLGAAYIAAHANEAAGFYLIYSRFWELALGVLAFQVSSRPSAIFPWTKFTSLICAAIVGYALATTAPNQTPYPASLLPCGAIALLLILIRARQEAGALRAVLTSMPMVYIGRISYSLYLWHWPVFVLFRWTVGMQTPATATAATVIATAAAAASYRFVEKPPRQLLARGGTTPCIAIAAALGLAVTVYPLEKFVWSQQSALSLSTVVRNSQDWYPDATVKTISAAGCKVHPLPDKALEISALIVQRSACPPPAARPGALYILGDSHAGAYLGLLANYVLTTGADGMLYYQGGCAMLGQQPNNAPACGIFITKAVADIARRLHPGDTVFLPGLRIPRITDEYIHFGLPHAQSTMSAPDQQKWRVADTAAELPVLAHLVTMGAVIVLEAPKPEFGAPSFRCADWFNMMNPICADGPTIDRSTIEALRAPVMAEFQVVTTKLPSIRVWDPLPLLCPADICSAYDNGKPLFFDADHLSGYANRKLASAFKQFLNPPPT